MRRIAGAALVGLVTLLAACGSVKPIAWPAPSAEWKSEQIKFPLDFAPNVKHTGVEQLHFAPGFFAPEEGGFWSYVFVWRTNDAAKLTDAQVATELTEYFRGLLVHVASSTHAELDPSMIAVTAQPAIAPGHFDIAAHLFDAFNAGAAVDLVGTAERKQCKTGALWIFMLAPSDSPVLPDLEKLAQQASCN